MILKKNSIDFFLSKNSNHIILKLKINGKDCQLIVDTGASNSCLDISTKKKFNLSISKGDDLAYSATDSIKNIFHSYENSLEINSTKINIDFILFDMKKLKNYFEKNENEKVDGIIGIDFLKRFNAKIDFESKRIFLNF